MPRPKSERPTYSLAKRGDVYYVQWWEDGRARRVSSRTSNQSQARRFLAEFRAGRDAPDIPALPTIGAVIDGYLAEKGPQNHSKTIYYDCTTLKKFFADLPVDLLTRDQVRIYTAERRKAGAQGAPAQYRTKVRPLSNGTLIRELGTLRAALAWAVKERWIAAAPFVERPAAPRARERWLTRAEAHRLLDAAKKSHIRLFIALALYTGGRAGALLELTWEQVDFERNTIDLGESRGRKRRPIVPIVDDLRPILGEAMKVATSQWVIEYGGSPVASIKTGFRAAVRRAKLVGVTPHILRHTAATWMVQKGISTKMVAAYLGNTEQMIETVYGHHSPEWMRAAASALSLKPRHLAEET